MLAQRVGAARDLPGVFRALRDFAHRTTPDFAGIFVALVDEETRLRRCIYSAGPEEEDDVSGLPALPLNESPQSLAVLAVDGIVVADLQDHYRRRGVESVLLGMEQDHRLPQSALALPLTVLGRLIGAFEIQSHALSAYGREHVTGMRMAASIAAIAAENVQLLELERDLRLRAQASETRFRSLIEKSTDGVILLNDAGRVLYASPAAGRILAYAPEELVGKSVFDRAHPDERESLLGAPPELWSSEGASAPTRHRVRRKDGEWRWLASVATNLLTEPGVEATVVNFRDVTDRVQAEEIQRRADQLEEQNLLIREADRLKAEFVGQMSHELRTPLNAVLGFAQLLEMDPLTPIQQENVSHILKAGRHLLDLINEVLDIAKIEAGRLSVSVEPVFVKELISESADLIRPLTVEGRLQVKLLLGDDDPLVLADRQRLKQILLNLLSNAVKFNRPGGEVVVCCESPQGRLRISVSDTGPGIAPEFMGRLFVPFERLGMERTGREGTGLGLALSKRLAEAMGGQIGAHSTVGQGTTFWLELPLAEGAGAGPTLESEENGGGASRDRRPGGLVLYIEDNLSNLQLLQQVFAHRPELELVPAAQGRGGLDLARERRPDLILLDLHLPDMPGEDVLLGLQASPETRGIPVIVISADAADGRRRRLHESGAAAYLTKPLDVRKLLDLLDETLRKAPSP